jgi:hypothetical protein
VTNEKNHFSVFRRIVLSHKRRDIISFLQTVLLLQLTPQLSTTNVDNHKVFVGGSPLPLLSFIFTQLSGLPTALPLTVHTYVLQGSPHIPNHYMNASWKNRPARWLHSAVNISLLVPHRKTGNYQITLTRCWHCYSPTAEAECDRPLRCCNLYSGRNWPKFQRFLMPPTPGGRIVLQATYHQV